MATAIQQISECSASDRRGSNRYPVAANLQYRVVHRGKLLVAGYGRTINISNCGILFDSREKLSVRMRIELFISWPAPLKNGAPVTMHVIGRVVRTANHLTAIAILRHKFKLAA